MKFILFHGAFSSPEENWFPQLKEKLEALEQEVIVPRFPVENWNEFTKSGPGTIASKQTLDKWLDTFRSEILPLFKKSDKLCFVGHSLGCVFILHAVLKFNLRLDSAIFVSPFMDRLNSEIWQFDAANSSFYKTDFDFDRLKKLISVSYVLHSDDDPYVKKSHALLFSRSLESSLIFIKRAGHLNSEVNLNEFPLVFDLCTTRLDLSLYRRYIQHLSERFASDYLKKNRKLEIHLDPGDIFDEAKFHFENLHYKGFCTFWSDLPDLDPENQYYKDCRRAAQRIKNLTRVVMVKNISDLERPVLIKQIGLDLKAGINIYLCMFEAIKDEVKDPDFGIWDTDYLCTIHYDSEKHMTETVLSSKEDDLTRAKEWEQYILSRAFRIRKIGDIRKFINDNSS